MCSDYNIPSFEMPKSFEDALLNSSPAFAPSIKGLNIEYESILMHKITEKFKNYKPIDLLRKEFPGQDIVTFGDAHPDKRSGKLVPSEIVYTAVIEQGSLQGLDYIFQIDDLQNNPNKNTAVIGGAK